MHYFGEDMVFSYYNWKKIRKSILKITPKEAREIGVTRSALWKIKQKIKQRKELNPKTEAVRRLVSYFG